MKEQLSYLYKPEFIEINGLVILSSEINNYENNKNKFDNPTDLELFLNHVHILDHFDNNAELAEEPFYNENASDFIFSWEVAKELVDIWSKQLKDKFPNFQFEITATKYDNPIIRFCRLRKPAKNNFIKSFDTYSKIS